MSNTLLALLLSLSVLASTATASPALSLDNANSASDTALDSSTDEQEPETSTQAEPQTDYSVNTFYALLVAEMAGQRQLYDLALGNYLLEAHRTQDAGVTARATQIAQYIGAEQAALDAATLWVKLDANNPLAQLAITSELVKAARFSESVIHLQKAIDLDAMVNVNFITDLGSRMTEGARELWLENLTPLLQHYQKNQPLIFNLASLHQQQQNYPQAIELLSKLLKQNAKYHPAWSLKARLYATLDQLDDALETADTALEHYPNDKAFSILKARLLIKKKQVKKARSVFSEIAEHNPEDAHILLPLALTQIELKEHDDAKTTLNKLLGLRQMTSEANYYLGRIEHQQKNLGQALQHYLAVRGGREYLAAQNSIMQIHLSQKNIDAALEHVREQRTQDPQNQQAYFLMEVELLNRSGQFEASLNVLNDALNAYTDNTELRYSRAMVAEKLGNFDQLEQDLAYIIDKDPKNATALNALGYTLADRSRRLEEALSFIQQARNLAPKDPAIIDSLGWVYYRLGRIHEALELLQQAYVLFPDGEVAAHLGEVLWASGEKEKAMEIWEKALDQQPKHRIIIQTLDRLQVQR